MYRRQNRYFVIEIAICISKLKGVLLFKNTKKKIYKYVLYVKRMIIRGKQQHYKINRNTLFHQIFLLNIYMQENTFISNVHTRFGALRVLTAWVFHTGRVCDVWRNFQFSCTCRTTMIFGTLKDSSLKLDCFPLNNCFSYRNVLQNSVNASSKMVFKKSNFLSQS